MRVVRLTPYIRAMQRMGFDRRGMTEFELDFVTAPAAHPIVQDRFGIRGARFTTSRRGRSDEGLTVYYLALPSTIYMMTATPGCESDDLSPDQRSAIEAMFESFARNLQSSQESSRI